MEYWLWSYLLGLVAPLPIADHFSWCGPSFSWCGISTLHPNLIREIKTSNKVTCWKSKLLKMNTLHFITYISKCQDRPLISTYRGGGYHGTTSISPKCGSSPGMWFRECNLSKKMRRQVEHVTTTTFARSSDHLITLWHAGGSSTPAPLAHFLLGLPIKVRSAM